MSNSFRHLPKLPYCGLTIVLSNPSRFDTRELLTGSAGAWFLDALKREANGKILRFHCDIRTSNTRDAGLLPDTRVVLCLGEVAQHEWFASSTELKAQRGSPVLRDSVVYVSSFTPQDACDFQAYEQRLNANYRGNADGDEEGDDSEAKGHKGSTKRTNYKFWLGRDIAKAIRILRNGLSRGTPSSHVLYPVAEPVITALQSTKNSTFYLDIETLFDRTLTCLGFAFEGDGPVWVLPIRRYNGTPAYELPVLCRLMRALGTAMRDNLCVTHNGHAFDWLVLAHQYRVPFGRRLYDTMISHNRCWPEAEKSLGHCLSLWTDEPYHKEDGVFDPKTSAQEQALWEYNAKDVHAMRLLKAAFDAECEKDSGIAASIAQGQKMIYPYLVASLKGIKANEEAIQKIVTENDRYLAQLLRIAKILLGKDTYNYLQGKSEAGFLSSNKQAAKYFYDIQGYKCPHKTDTGEDAVDTKAMLKLAISLKKRGIENPLIPLRLKFAEVRKETSMLANLNLWPEKSYAQC